MDVNCPYCGAEQEINHDDGYGYEEDTLHKQECSVCGKSFAYTTTVCFFYEAQCADCLNGGEHKFAPTSTWPKSKTRMKCASCGKMRTCTDQEMAEICRNK